MTAVPLKDVFGVLHLTMGLIEHGVGIDPWRMRAKPGLLPERHPLREEGTFPTSKPNGINTGDESGLWNNFHMRMMIPALMRLSKSVEEVSPLSKIELTEEEAVTYLHRYEEVSGHVQQWEEDRDLIEGLEYPEDPNDLPDDLKILLLDEIENKHNHLASRLLQACYAEFSGDYIWYGLPAQTKRYFKGGDDVFTRTREYVFEEIEQCPLNTDGPVNAQRALRYYSWLAQPRVVEMTTPEFSGAAMTASFRLTAFLDFLYRKTDGEVDLRQAQIRGKYVDELKTDPSFQARLAAMEDFFHEHREHPDLISFKPYLPSLKTIRKAVQPVCAHA